MASESFLYGWPGGKSNCRQGDGFVSERMVFAEERPLVVAHKSAARKAAYRSQSTWTEGGGIPRQYLSVFVVLSPMFEIPAVSIIILHH